MITSNESVAEHPPVLKDNILVHDIRTQPLPQDKPAMSLHSLRMTLSSDAVVTVLAPLRPAARRFGPVNLYAKQCILYISTTRKEDRAYSLLRLALHFYGLDVGLYSLYVHIQETRNFHFPTCSFTSS